LKPHLRGLTLGFGFGWEDMRLFFSNFLVNHQTALTLRHGGMRRKTTKHNVVEVPGPNVAVT
jgi:hypothetical protein